jgi:hypothetical protein
MAPNFMKFTTQAKLNELWRFCQDMWHTRYACPSYNLELYLLVAMLIVSLVKGRSFSHASLRNESLHVVCGDHGLVVTT